MPNFHVVYDDCQVSDPNQDPIHGIVSPSARKPKLVAEALKAAYPELTFERPAKLAVEDFYMAHDRTFVDDVFAKRRKNGFGTFSDSVNESLPYTNGAMYRACELAQPDQPVAALVSGFHHAGYAGFEKLGYFCTFNGLVVSAFKMMRDHSIERVAIIDCDMCGESRMTWDIHGHRTYMCGYPTPLDENNKKVKPTPCEGGRYDLWSAEIESLWPDFSDLLKDLN